MTTAYATRKDVYELGGLARGALGGAQSRLVSSCVSSTDTVTLEDHGFTTDDEILFAAADGGTLSAPLVAGTSYYAIRVNDSTFKVAATPAGSAINLTTDGASMKVATPLPFDRVLEMFSRHVDSYMPAHLVPLQREKDGNYHPLVVSAVSKLTASEIQHLSGAASTTTEATRAQASEQLKVWSSGLPLRTTTNGSANRAISQASGNPTDPRGWGSGSLP